MPLEIMMADIGRWGHGRRRQAVMSRRRLDVEARRVYGRGRFLRCRAACQPACVISLDGLL